MSKVSPRQGSISEDLQQVLCWLFLGSQSESVISTDKFIITTNLRMVLRKLNIEELSRILARPIE